MSEAEQVAGEQAAATTTPAKAKTEYTDVKMEDGRDVKFAGKRKLNREVILSEDGNSVTVRFDFVNGKTLSLSSTEVPTKAALQLLGHGIAQKVGDESAGVEKVEDMVLGTENMITRLRGGEFYTVKAAGDSFSGASIVIKAIVEATGKPVDWVKTFLQKKLDAAAAAGEKLSRKDLYDSFRNPATKTGTIIERLEREERSKNSKVSADDLVAQMSAEA